MLDHTAVNSPGLVCLPRSRLATSLVVVENPLSEFQQLLATLELETWVPRAFLLVEAESDVDLLARIADVEPS